MSAIVFWANAGLLVYTYVGYPLVIVLWAKWRPRRHREREWCPFVSLVIVAYNENATIESKIRNCLSVDYPTDCLQIVVVSDGSTDATAAIARFAGSERVEVVAFESRRGKPAVLNQVVPRLAGEIVVLADARQRLEPAALRMLVRPFADPEVGVVSGELVLDQSAASGVGSGVSVYWGYEKLIRRSESAVDSTIGATGALYAIRRALFISIPDDTILDDVQIPLRIMKQGYRVLFERRARTFDSPSASSRQEWVRKVRTIAGTFQLFSRERWLLSPVRNRLWVQTVSHKGLRLLLPPFHAVAVIANARLLMENGLYAWTFAGQVAFYLAALAGYATRHRRDRSRLLSVPYACCLLVWATFVGFVRFVRGTQPVTWEPSRLEGSPLEVSGMRADKLAAE